MFGEIIATWFVLAVVVFVLTMILTVATNWFNLYKYAIGLYIVLAVITWFVVPMTHFFYITPIVAEKGIFFKDRINLDKHVKIGDGMSIIYDYDIYTRSDRSNEIITVYKK
jgi:hypothetical protein